MTQDKFVQLMVESGLARYVQVEKTCVSNALQRFAALVAAHEREKFCALLRQLHDSYSLQSSPRGLTKSNTGE